MDDSAQEVFAPAGGGEVMNGEVMNVVNGPSLIRRVGVAVGALALGGGALMATAAPASAAHLPSYSVSDATVGEGDGGVNTPKPAKFFVTRAGNLESHGTVQFRTESGTSGPRAISEVDFKKVDTIVHFSPGVSSVQVRVKVIGDNLNEGTERFRVVLANPTNGVLGDSLGIGTILDT